MSATTFCETLLMDELDDAAETLPSGLYLRAANVAKELRTMRYREADLLTRLIHANEALNTLSIKHKTLLTEFLELKEHVDQQSHDLRSMRDRMAKYERMVGENMTLRSGRVVALD